MTDATTLMQRLMDPDESERAWAAEDAGDEDDPTSIGPLVDRLQREPARVVRQAIAAALERMSHAAVCDAVAPVLSSDDAFVRAAAVSILRSKGEASLDALRGVFERGGEDERKLVVDALAAIPGAGAEALLLAALDDADVNVRIAAVEQLGERRSAAAREPIERLFARDPDAMLLSAALASLEVIGAPDTWEVIRQKYPDASEVPPHLLTQWLRAMALWGPAEGLRVLLASAPRVAPAMRDGWVDALETHRARFDFDRVEAGELGVALSVLRASPGSATAFRVLRWLGGLRAQPAALDVLIAYADAPHALERSGAVQGLAHFGGEAARAALARRRVDETDGEVLACLARAAGSAMARPWA